MALQLQLDGRKGQIRCSTLVVHEALKVEVEAVEAFRSKGPLSWHEKVNSIKWDKFGRRRPEAQNIIC